jgi:hypothetical protein
MFPLDIYGKVKFVPVLNYHAMMTKEAKEFQFATLNVILPFVYTT